MRTAKLSGLVSQFGRDPPGHPSAADGDLLARFVASRDEAAFAEIVRRYGPLVFAVCRRVTGSHHLAEDAFQAVFVVLAAKTATVRPASALPGWLHTVACRTALRARTMNDRRRRREAPVEYLPEPAGIVPEPPDDLAAILDEEIAKLPDALRIAVVMCELEGCARKVAAERLGVPEGTVSSRLAAARKALAKQFRARGVVLSAAALTAALARRTSAGVSADLAARAVSAATSPALAPAAVAALSNGVLRLMFAQKLKAVVPLAALGALTFAAFAGGPSAPELPPVKPVKPVAFAPIPAPVPVKADPKPQPAGPNKILFYRSGHLVLIDPDGKNEQQVSKDRDKYNPGGGALLSPDGQSIAVLILGPPPPDDGAAGAKRRPATLHVRKLDEQEPGTSLEVQCQAFAWSPDGTQLACSEFEDGPSKKLEATHFTVDVKTKKKSPLQVPKDHIITDWARNGRFLVTTRVLEESDDKLTPNVRVYLADVGGKQFSSATDDKQPATLGRASPDGKRLLVSTFAPPPKDKSAPARRELAVADTETKKVTAVADVPLNAELLSYCWSPDGKRIAYAWRQIHEGKPEDNNEKETESFLVVCDPDGKNQKTIALEKGKGQWSITIGQIDWR